MIENIKKFVKSKSFVIGYILLLILAIVGILVFALPRTNISTYISIAPIEQTEIKIMTERQALDLLVQQETDLDKYISKHPNANIDKLFETFYRNMLLFTGKKSDMDSKLSFDIYDYTENEQKSFIVKNITVNYANENTYKITSPQNDIIRIVPIEEGIWGAEINDEYMIKKYSKNLSKEWNEYLKIFSDNNWWLDSFYDEIKFLSIYPNFCMQDIINSDLKNYMSKFSEYTNYYCNSDNDEALYQKFLSIKDNNIQEYQNIKQWYASLRLEQNETWKKLKDHIYFDTKSLKITDDYREGYFKIYKGAEDNNFLFDLYDNAFYAVYKIYIDNTGNIIFPEYEYFDKNGNSIFAEAPFAHGEEKYSEYKNGQIYYNALYKNQ